MTIETTAEKPKKTRANGKEEPSETVLNSPMVDGDPPVTTITMPLGPNVTGCAAVVPPGSMTTLEEGKAYELGPDGVRELTPEETATLHTDQPVTLETSGCAVPSDAKPMSWAEAASAADAARVEVETIEEVLDIKLTDGDLADIARANAADDQEKTTRQRHVDDLKIELKDEKSAIDALTARMHDRNNAVLKGTQARKASWRVESVFATNTARYFDPTSGRLVHERALRPEERQINLPLANTDKTPQLSLGDDTTADDPTAMTEPDALLKAAQEGEEASPSNTTLENEPSFSDLGDDDEDDDVQASDDEDD